MKQSDGLTFTANDEKRAQLLAQRLIDLAHHCEEALYHCPDEPLFSYQSAFTAEARRITDEGQIVQRAIAICTERLEAEEIDKARILSAWRSRAQELRDGTFIDRQSESKALFEEHKNDSDGGRSVVERYREIVKNERKRNEAARDSDPFYYVTPKTPKPINASWWFYNRILEARDEEFMLYREGLRIGEGAANYAHGQGFKKPKTREEVLWSFLEDGEEIEGCNSDAVRLAITTIAKELRLDELPPKDVRKNQLKRAADWLLSERASGIIRSIPEAAKNFEAEINKEKYSGGYEDADSLKTALYRKSKLLGIESFKESRH